MSSVFIDANLSDDERRARLWAGDIFIYSATPGTRALIALAQEMLEKEFAPLDPRALHKHHTAEDVAAVLGVLKPKFIHHPEYESL